MPWTSKQFHDRHAKHLTPAQSARAAAMANAMLKGGADEGVAIATANKYARPKGPGAVQKKPK